MVDTQKETMTKEFQKHAKDTGSIEVQVASLTSDIDRLTAHFKAFPKDYNSKRGLMQKVGRRKQFLSYLKRKNDALYAKLLERLDIRG